MQENHPRSAAVIGGGFIGVEMAENLHAAGLAVSIIEMQNQVMAPMDYEMAQLLHENMELNGVRLLLEDGVKSFGQENGQVKILLSGGRKVNADMVILSIGVRPNSALAADAGLALNERGGIVVNGHLQTSVPNIYAVGDVIEVTQFTTGNKTMIPLAGPANKQARICADNIVGDKKVYEGTLGASVAKCFDLTAAAVGINEKTLLASGKKKGRDYDTILIQQKSHAGYYPGAVPMTLKLIFDGAAKILGAQIIGQDGVDKRVDTIASVMRLHGTTDALAELELAYAPPYSSAKDPVNMAGFMIEDLESGKVRQFHWNDVEDLPCDGSATLLDVRTEGEYRRGHLNGFRNIPLDDLREHLDELERDKPIYVNCQTGLRSYLACRLLTQYGFSCAHLSGGYSFYQVVTQEQQTARSAYPCGMEKL